MRVTPRPSLVEELPSGLAQALGALADAARGQNPEPELEHDLPHRSRARGPIACNAR
jgi:hypothetical protein